MLWRPRSTVLAIPFAACSAIVPPPAPQVPEAPRAAPPAASALVRASSAAPQRLIGAALAPDWSGDARYWSLEQGEIVGRSSAAAPCDKTTYLFLDAVLPADFELTGEYRLLSGNSGIQVRTERRGAGFTEVVGLQADLSAPAEDGRSFTGGWYESNGRGVLVPRGTDLYCGDDGAQLAALIGEPAELLAAVVEPGWHGFAIRARGPRLSYTIDGRLMSALTDRDARMFRAGGRIALQLHAGPPMEVRFRDLELRALEPLAPDEWRELEPPRDASAGATPVEWIWAGHDASGGGRAYLLRRFELAEQPSRATLVVSGDNRADVWLNGTLLGRSDDWTRPARLEAAHALRSGANVLAVQGRNDGGPAAVALALEWTLASGERGRVVSDASWLASAAPEPAWNTPGFRAGGWSPATSFGALGVQPWGHVPEFPGAESPQATPAAALRVPTDLGVELLYSVPRATLGSWVSLAADPRGRLYASDQYGSIWRVTLGTRGTPPIVEEVDVACGEAHGLTWAGGALYAVVSSGGRTASGLWRITDGDGDDRLDSAELLRAFDGDGEHGPHSVVARGASLYVIAGNHTALPEPIDRYLLPPTWGEDQLLGHRDDPNGHAVGIMAPGGWVCRTDLDGREWTLVSAGLRNCYDAAWLPELGALVGWDSDMEWEVGLPWYRPTRLVVLGAGLDHGWRNSNAKWPSWVPDAAPPLVEVGLGSPSGSVSYEGLALPERYRGAVFCGDWAYGRILAMTRDSSGAWAVEELAAGRPLAVSDLASGPDGALYFVTGGRGIQSGLYRLSAREPCARLAAPAAEPGRAPIDAELYDELRRGDEAEVLPWLWLGMGHADPWLRQTCRAFAEGLAPDLVRARALGEADPVRSIQALIALVHVGGPELRAPILTRLVELPWDGPQMPELADRLRVISIALARFGRPEGSDDGERAALLAALDPLFPPGGAAREARVERQLAEILVVLDAPGIVERALDRMERGVTQEDQLAFAFALGDARGPWSTDAYRRYFTWSRERAVSFVGGESFRKHLRRLEHDVEAGMVPEQRAELAELLAPAPRPPNAPGAPGPVGAMPPGNGWRMDDLVALAPELARGRDFERGRQAFERASCLQCHRIGERESPGALEGGNRGPDLTGAGARFSPRDLFEALLEPSRTISDQYRDHEVHTTDGGVLVGRLVSETSLGVELFATFGTTERRVFVEAEDIELSRPSPLSRMPSGLLDPLGREELLDLVAYVLAGADARAPAFTTAR
jgi:putative heme-binding domain-containing protein